MSGSLGPELAVRLGDQGDVTQTHRLWHQPRAPQRIGSGVIHQGHIYILNDSGVAECIELRTGKRVWKERLGGKSWSSMVRSGDRLYAVSKKGDCHVVGASTKFEVLATNSLAERTYASLAVSGGELFIRTFENLWCIAEAK
jgi:outer membrane protein assembly factor BamB